MRNTIKVTTNQSTLNTKLSKVPKPTNKSSPAISNQIHNPKVNNYQNRTNNTQP